MKELSDLFLLELWRRTGVLGVVVAGVLTGFPVVILLSWMLDGPPAKQEISVTAVEIWSGRLVEFRSDPERGFIATIQSATDDKQVLLVGIEVSSCDPKTSVDAMNWLKRNLPLGSVLVVYVQQRATHTIPMQAHLVKGNTWINGSLIELGLAKVSARSPFKANNAGRDALCQLQEEAQGHQRGFWGRTQ